MMDFVSVSVIVLAVTLYIVLQNVTTGKLGKGYTGPLRTPLYRLLQLYVNLQDLKIKSLK